MSVAINQVFMNIISNAIDALSNYNSQRPSAEIYLNLNRIWITTEIIGANCVIRIADNGSGMTEEVKKRLFDPFFITKAVGKGTGLGLSISYQIIVEKHGGTLKCLSEIGQGTEFLIEIPLDFNKEITSSKQSTGVWTKSSGSEKIT
ncbi:sensor histidine kinase [Nostoc flagelliforme]|uniref:sensor histidine kinase n=1 Tax=Nostoc flagelliforme TaxID=1306274 RepID=UPI0030CED56A